MFRPAALEAGHFFQIPLEFVHDGILRGAVAPAPVGFPYVLHDSVYVVMYPAAKIVALQVELAHVDGEIEKLVDSLTGANNVLLSYVNVKIAELDGRKQELVKRIADLTVEAISPEQVSQISGYLDTWDSVSFDDKRWVVDLMITTIAATSEAINITWKI